MINFQELQLKVNEKYSFVGIEKCGTEAVFCLPKGFEPNLFTTYDSKRDLFFLFYQILNRFKTICSQKGYLQTSTDIKIQDRDGTIRTSGSIQQICLSDAEAEENIFYSKLDFIDSILSVFDELKILSLAYRLGRSEKIDYSKLHLFLHRAVYLDNGAIYVDSMTLPRLEVHFQPTDIVSMYCYILVEIKQQLNEKVSNEVAALAEEFKHRYIGTEHSLFHEKHSNQVINVLKNALELIDKNTPLKDADFWYFYDAIELFLYGELSKVDDGEVWGIKNFHSVWESMCLTYLAKTLEPKHILHLDTKYLASNVIQSANRQSKLIDLTNLFTINNEKLVPKNQKLVPDAVILSNYFPFPPVIKDFNITQGNWDDYSFKTTFYSDLDYFIRYYQKQASCDFFTELRIVCEYQMPHRHTFTELKKFYKQQNNDLIINAQLPSNFYSFWDLEILNEFNHEVLALMQSLNHIFYVAIKDCACAPDSLYQFLIDTNNKFTMHTFFNSKVNAFKNSLLRYFGIPTQEKINTSELFSKFNRFLRAISCLKIIDVKYLNCDYFFDINNRREIKKNSVRKQFVYEYILQQYIYQNDDLMDLEIESEFWLPYWKINSELFQNAPEYIDNYISLKLVNFATTVKTYLN